MHVSNHQQTASHAGDGTFARIDDLEGRLRGMIMKNNPSTAGNALKDGQSAEPSTSLATRSLDGVANGLEEASNGSKQRRKPRKANVRLSSASIEDSTTPVTKSSIQDGQDLDKQHEAPRGRGRRPNQAQRKQKGKVDLQAPLSMPTMDNHQPNSQAISPQIHPASHPQASGIPRVSIDPTDGQFSDFKHRQTLQHQQYRANQQRQQQSHLPVQMQQHHQNHHQHASHPRGFIPHANHRFGPTPGHTIMALPNTGSVQEKF